MKFIVVLCAIVGVFPVSEMSAQGVVNLTADVTCPQRVVTLTCVLKNVSFTSLGWTRDNGVNLDQPPVAYIINNEDEYPFQVDVSSVMGILNFTIINASVQSGLSDYTAELVIDLDVLYTELGYRSLQCGSVVRDANIDFTTQLGVEAPLGFEVNRFDLVYNATTPNRLEELLMQTGRPAYSSTTCSYTNETYLNTSIAGTVVRTMVVNDNNCMEDVCSLELTDVVDGAGDVNLSVVAGNRFESTAATPSNIQFPLSTGDNFDPTLMYTNDCQFSVECAIFDIPLDMVICEISYGRDSSYQDSETVLIPFNEKSLIRELEASTTYYVEVVYHTRSMEVDIFYHFRRNFTTEADCAPTKTNIVVIVVPVVVCVVALLVVVVVVILVALRCHTKSTSNEESVTLSSVNKTNPDVSVSESAPKPDGFPYASFNSTAAENMPIQTDTEHKGIGDDIDGAFEHQILEKRIETHNYEAVPA